MHWTLREAAAGNRLPKALVVVHLYGQSADMDPILRACAEYGVTVIEDAAAGAPELSPNMLEEHKTSGRQLIASAR